MGFVQTFDEAGFQTVGLADLTVERDHVIPSREPFHARGAWQRMNGSNERRHRWQLVFGVLAGAAAVVAPARASAQVAPVSVRVRVLAAAQPVESARVTSGAHVGMTDAAGEHTLRLEPGPHRIRVEAFGLETVEESFVIGVRDTTIVIVMAVEAVEHEAIVVRSTRTERRIEDEAVRVEVVSREEVEEKLLMTPGDIAMLLNETAGLRVQPTAPSLGGASVRIQGLRGRYTQILSDGLPLYGGQTGALGPLQIPPMDLAQVEVIKGVASALYGASALGGVVNLISRRPEEERERELLLNQSTLGGTDAILWSSGWIDESWGYTLLASGHRQSDADVDDDGWADVPAFRRVVVRPRLFWNDGRGASALLTVGGMLEARDGGTVAGGTTPDGSTFSETLDTRRIDAGAVARVLLGGSRLLSLRGSGVVQSHDHGFGARRERDVHATGFSELALSGSAGPHSWVIGAAIQRDDYSAEDVSGFDYAFTIPSVFVQDEYAAAGWLTVSASARFDHHSEYGSFLHPRVSLLLRPAGEWTVRASGGTGYFAPTPWVEEAEAVGLGRLVEWPHLEAERARSASIDVGRTFGPIELNATLFASRIEDAVQVRIAASDGSTLALVNAPSAVRTRGTELLARYHVEGIHVTATHVFMRSTEPHPETGVRRDVPLTPRHTVGLVAAWEQEGQGRIGAEFYYTGRQEIDENPYRTTSEPHVIVGFLIERRFGAARVFLNAENILDTRQTRHDRLPLPAQSPDGRWITDVWAPLEGRSFNAGVRWAF
jgi:iron complex outermembrane receptor protein